MSEKNAGLLQDYIAPQDLFKDEFSCEESSMMEREYITPADLHIDKVDVDEKNDRVKLGLEIVLTGLGDLKSNIVGPDMEVRTYVQRDVDESVVRFQIHGPRQYFTEIIVKIAE